MQTGQRVLYFLFLFVLASAVIQTAQSQSPPPPASPAQHSQTTHQPDIKKMMAEIEAKNIKATITKLVSFGTRNTLSAQDNPLRGIGAARDWIAGEFQQISAACGNCLQVEKQTFVQPKMIRVPEPTTLTNVLATLKGVANPDRVYVVSGHYDSMCALPIDASCDAPGANDDASGVAAVIEMARVMSKRKFNATIIFIAVAGEEQGLLGATYFAEQAAEKKIDIEAMFTNDIIGGVTTQRANRNTVRVFSEGVPSDETEQQANTRRNTGGENDSSSRQLARFIKETADLYSPRFGVNMIFRRDRYLRGGDHKPFLEHGFTAVRFTEPNEDYDHQHQNVRIENGKQFGDLPAFVDFNYVAQVARINAASLARLALAPARPRHAGIVVARLGNDTELKWDTSGEADLAGYEIVWRDTTAAVWTNALPIGKFNGYVLKNKSKDNYFFGVRAVDKFGNKSMVSFPQPVLQ